MNSSRKNKSKIRVEILSKRDCHLCDEAKKFLIAAQKQYALEIKETDITQDKTLFDRYKEEIPVIFINGRKSFKFRVEPEEFRKKIVNVLNAS